MAGGGVLRQQLVDLEGERINLLGSPVMVLRVPGVGG
jgi:hypothetical protein